MTTATATTHGIGPLWTMPGVYAPQEDTYLLARALRAEGVRAGMDVLDVGTGSGALALLAARMGARVAATDISWRAVATARINAARVRQRVRVLQGDLTAPLGGHKFDVVVSNPPYVPSPAGNRPPRGAATAWDAGHDGRLHVDRMCDRAPKLLRPHGVLLMVHSALCGVDRTVHRLAEAGLACTIADRAYIPFGPVLTRRLSWLRERGLVHEGQDKEELVVIRAQRA